MNNIDLQYKNITAVLTKELAVYETIIDLFRQKQDCILKGNIDNLKSIVEEIQSSSALAKKYQTERDAITKLILNEMNDNSTHTMKSLIKVFDSKRSNELEMLYYKLKSSAMRVTELGRENDYLLSASVEHIKNLVSLFIDRKDSTSINYNNDGLLSESKLEHKVLDIQV
ncbi:MAG: hypothetical protein CBD04_004495 [bacterium TMED144]|nr:MAG: hypothetical protein CBD04_004495 [bacterium TMED144]|tara:strand:+ start:171 stop:680 length:510 start_codon:yes stop_codon:yes gene_type:complete